MLGADLCLQTWFRGRRHSTVFQGFEGSGNTVAHKIDFVPINKQISLIFLSQKEREKLRNSYCSTGVVVNTMAYKHKGERAVLYESIAQVSGLCTALFFF